MYKHLHNHLPTCLGSPTIIFRSGAKYCDAMKMIDSLPASVTHIILNVGTNDIHSNDIDIALSSVMSLIHHVQRTRPDTDITLTHVLPRLPDGHKQYSNTEWVDQFNRKAHQFNLLLVKLVACFAGVFLVDHPQFRCIRAPLAKDGLHPNFKGVEIMSGNLMQYMIYESLFKRTQHTITPTVQQQQPHPPPPKMVAAAASTISAPLDTNPSPPLKQTPPRTMVTSRFTQTDVPKFRDFCIQCDLAAEPRDRPQKKKKTGKPPARGASTSPKINGSNPAKNTGTKNTTPQKTHSESQPTTPIFVTPPTGAATFTTPTGRVLRSQRKKQ
jgi:hypothetical protein